MDEQKMIEMAEKIGTEWCGDKINSLSEDEFQNGLIKANIQEIDNIDSLNGEGVFCWVEKEDMAHYHDDEYYGVIPAILLNTPYYQWRYALLGDESLPEMQWTVQADALERLAPECST